MRVGAALIPAHAQAAAQHRLEIIRPALSQVAQGVSIRGSAHWLKKTKKDVPSAVTIARWLSAYLRGSWSRKAGRMRMSTTSAAISRLAWRCAQTTGDANATGASWRRCSGV
jgi:hypothetical protein